MLRWIGNFNTRNYLCFLIRTPADICENDPFRRAARCQVNNPPFLGFDFMKLSNVECRSERMKKFQHLQEVKSVKLIIS